MGFSILEGSWNSFYLGSWGQLYFLFGIGQKFGEGSRSERGQLRNSVLDAVALEWSKGPPSPVSRETGQKRAQG